MKEDMRGRLIEALAKSADMPAEESIERTIMLAQEEWSGREQKIRISFWQLLLGQVRFIGWKIWALQAGISLVILLAGRVWAQMWKETKSVTPKQAVFLSGCFGVLFVMLIIPFLYRSIRYQMMETESAAFFAGRRLLLCRVILLLAGDIVMLVGFSVVSAAGSRGMLRMGDALACQMAVFFLCCNGVLYFLRKTDLPKLCARCGEFGLFLFGVLCLLYKIFPAYDGAGFAGGLAVLGIGLAAAGVYQGYLLVKAPEESIYA